MKKLDFRNSYSKYVSSIKRMTTGKNKAMEHAIGGQFKAFGILERELLILCGLQKDDYLIDIGCGSGRLAKPLSQYLAGKYLGTDVVPDLLDYAQTLVNRSDWKFETVTGIRIPEKDGVANMVCFFSVFTHLLHEQSYVYLTEAKRVLKPGGKIVFSFLEFAIPCHWDVFQANIKDINGSHPLNMFMSRDGIEAWTNHLDLEIIAIHNGDLPFIPVPHPLTLEDGRIIHEKGALGQSVCVLVKK